MAKTAHEVFSIGHSQLSYEVFLSTLKRIKITAIADVRTSPYSRYCPQFNRETLKESLQADGLAYVFLGKELGGRPQSDRFFCNGVADYEKMAQTKDFDDGLNRVINGSRNHRIALMCSEQHPLDCHRCLLVGRALHQKGISVQHIINEKIITQQHIEKDLLERQPEDFFMPTTAEKLSFAYNERAKKIAFSR